MAGNGEARPVVLVHGLWYGGWTLGRLAGVLRDHGFQPAVFGWSTRQPDLRHHADALQRFAQAQAGERLDFVAHSLGGLLLLEMLARDPGLPPGRVVLLSTPLAGSAVAERVSRWPGVGWLLGAAAGPLARGAVLPGQGFGRELGMVAGRRPLGLGLLAGRPGGPGDGTVAVAETRHPALADHLVLPVSHTGMLASRAVAEAAARFLERGHF
ncbi:MAG: alpha/beta hydrolase [Xanthomonadales bacterium]|nr:alpha/beta hydrolase [Xanthomonadales bacterium]